MSDETKFWLDILAENLKDESYIPAFDDEFCFKLAAFQEMMKQVEDRDRKEYDLLIPAQPP